MDNQTGARSKAGRKPSLTVADIEALRAITDEKRRSSLDEVTCELHRRTGAKACCATVRNAARAAGITPMKPERGPALRARVQGGKPVR